MLPPLTHPPVGLKSLLVGGWGAREASTTHPPASRENIPSRGVALLLGGHNPITLEYQIYPPTIDTLVTGLERGEIFEKSF